MMECLTRLNCNMKTKLKYILLSAILGIASTTIAQPENGPKDSLKQAKIEELKKLRKDLFIQKLNLTTAESEKFFPIYDEYQLKLKQSRKEFRKKWKDKKPEDLTEAEATVFLEDATALREKEVELFRTYSEKLKSAIPVKKIVILPRVEREVQRELIDKAREGRKGSNKNGKRGRGPGRDGRPPQGPPPPDGGPGE